MTRGRKALSSDGAQVQRWSTKVPMALDEEVKRFGVTSGVTVFTPTASFLTSLRVVRLEETSA